MILESISSSSHGNCHLLSNRDTTIMLDCGVLYSKMPSILTKDVKGVLITHEHSDHVKGLKSLIMNKLTKIYSTKETLSRLEIKYTSLLKEVIPYKLFSIGSFMIMPFEIEHDAVNPINYLIKDTISGAQFLYITDTGYIDNLTFEDIDYILIECNFDEKNYNKEILTKTEEIKKSRLMSNKGHLSIQKCVQFLRKTINHNTKKIILGHISRDNKNYLEFQETVKKECNFKNVIALNPSLIGSAITKLKDIN